MYLSKFTSMYKVIFVLLAGIIIACAVGYMGTCITFSSHGHYLSFSQQKSADPALCSVGWCWGGRSSRVQQFGLHLCPFSWVAVIHKEGAIAVEEDSGSGYGGKQGPVWEQNDWLVNVVESGVWRVSVWRMGPAEGKAKKIKDLEHGDTV